MICKKVTKFQFFTNVSLSVRDSFNFHALTKLKLKSVSLDFIQIMRYLYQFQTAHFIRKPIKNEIKGFLR